MPQDDLAWGFDQLDKRRKRYQLARAYYDGEHRLLFATERFTNAFANLFREFADNLCPAVVEAPAERLRITGWEGALAQPAADLWAALKMGRRAGDVHLDALKLGDQYVIVWPDASNRARIWPQDPEQVVVDYDDEDDPDRKVRAVKAWKARDGRYRANVYLPDRLERWVTKAKNPQQRPTAGHFRPFEEDDHGPEVANPSGRVPVFHFANNAPAGCFGRSELRDAIPVQDALNKAVCDLMVSMEFAALPQRWATGVQVEHDAQGRATKPWRSAPGAVWTVADKDARMGSFPAAELQQFLAVGDAFRLEMARVTGTPLHYMQLRGDPPSGEALRTLEARFTKKCEDRQGDWGPEWAAAVELGLSWDSPTALEAAAGADSRLSPVWAPAAVRDEKGEVERAGLKFAIHGSWRQALRELGYSPEDIDAIEGERETDAGAMADAMLASFDRGAPVPVGAMGAPPAAG